MTKLIEDMAQAMHDAWLSRAMEISPQNVTFDLDVPFGHLSERDAEYYRQEAHAALSIILASLREPSDAVTDVGHIECWQAMLSQWEKEQLGENDVKVHDDS